MPEVNKLIYKILKNLRDSMSADEFDEQRIAPERTGKRLWHRLEEDMKQTHKYYDGIPQRIRNLSKEELDKRIEEEEKRLAELNAHTK